MKLARLAVATCAVAALAAAGLATMGGRDVAPPAAPEAADPDVVPVLRVIDGDTIEVEWHGQVESVRLLGVDAPEVRRGKRLRAQAQAAGVSEDEMLERGKAAADALRERLAGRKVRLHWDGGYAKRDRYGRLLARAGIIAPGALPDIP